MLARRGVTFITDWYTTFRQFATEALTTSRYTIRGKGVHGHAVNPSALTDHDSGNPVMASSDTAARSAPFPGR